MGRVSKLIARVESPNKKLWIELYEDTTYKTTSYYYTTYDDGKNLGSISKKEAAQAVVDYAKAVGKRMNAINVLTIKDN